MRCRGMAPAPRRRYESTLRGESGESGEAMNDQSDRERALAGLGYGIAAYLIWGLLPAFMRLLVAVPPVEILAHRIVWSVLLLAGVVTLVRGWPKVAAVLRAPRLLGVMTLTALLIAGNWLLYIWAVNSAHVIETSLGYFINPLLNVALGVVVLGERLGRAQLVSVALAGAGVLYLGLAQGGVPWIALGLAISFSLYGLVRKMAPVDPLTGLFAETLLLAPAALTLLLYLGAEGRGTFGGDTATSGLLIASAMLTAGPLLMFAAAGKRLRYATIGLLQYIAPTMQFLLAVLLFREPLTEAHFVAFPLIWLGLAIFAYDAVAKARVPGVVR